MAQILLLELVGRGPDKPDNVVVVGDDDQSIYRFRGASYAAFERFRERFEAAPDVGTRTERRPTVDQPAAAREPAVDGQHPVCRQPADRPQPEAAQEGRR